MAGSACLCAVGLALVLAACEAAILAPPAPPTILRTGIATEVTTDGSAVEIRFASGPPARLSLAGLRLVTGGVAGGLVVLGSDAVGPFLAGFTTQEGLPAGCYVDNARGLDRGWLRRDPRDPLAEVVSHRGPRATRNRQGIPERYAVLFRRDGGNLGRRPPDGGAGCAACTAAPDGGRAECVGWPVAVVPSPAMPGPAGEQGASVPPGPVAWFTTGFGNSGCRWAGAFACD